MFNTKFDTTDLDSRGKTVATLTTKPTKRSVNCLFVIVALLVGWLLPAEAYEGPELPSPPTTIIPKEIDSSMKTMTADPLKTIAPGVFEMGSIRIDKNQRTVSFPAKLNLNNGLMEYFMVTSYGKTHESVLRSEVAPYQVHVAMLLLGAKGSTNQLGSAPSEHISSPGKEAVSGDKISLAISWTANGKEVRRPAEELLLNHESNSAMQSGGWAYNGSIVWAGSFLAQRNGSMVSLVTDPTALINFTGEGHANDHSWIVNTNNLPPFDLAVQVTIRLEANDK